MQRIIQKPVNEYVYTNSSGEIMVVVSFFTEARLDRYGKVLKSINAYNKFNELQRIPYYGKSLKIRIRPKDAKQTNLVRKATRKDLTVFADAYNNYLKDLREEELKEHKKNISLLLEEYNEEDFENVEPVVEQEKLEPLTKKKKADQGESVKILEPIK